MRERGDTDHDPARRRLLRQSLALAGMAALAAPTGRVAERDAWSDPHPALGRTLKRIAFGSCAEVDKPQPVWDPVLAREE